MMRGDHPFGWRAGEQLASLLRDAEVLADESLGGGGAEADDDPRLDHLELCLQPGMAGLNLAGRRFRVESAFAAHLDAEVFHRVRDVNCAAIDAGRFERLVQKPTGRTDEGAALQVLLISRSLAHENQFACAGSFPEDRLGGVFVEIATSAPVGGAA